MENKPHFIIIDDDRINNMICRMLISKIFKEVDVKDFTIAQEGLEFMKTEYAKDENKSAILLLDINMPIMSGWDFLVIFDELEESLKQKFQIYIVSSSIDYSDIEQAKSNRHVIGFLSKPLTKEALLAIVK